MTQPASAKPIAESLGWVVKSTRYLHRSQWFDVRQDVIVAPGGVERTYTYLEHPGSVFVVPVLDDGRILLIRSYRYTLDAWCWEVPAGGIGDKPGVDSRDVARHELQEEVGARCRELIEIGRFALGNGYASHLVTFFIADGVVADGEAELEDLEVIDRTRAFTVSEIQAMIARGDVADGDSALALLLAIRHLSPNESIDARPKAGER